MSQSQYSLTWDSYQNNICNGFSSLQQNGEFVDMTLAADGHMVKVHKLLIALASPYLKELINSAPCQHPVIFLNKVDHKTLCSILEYIYTGEVIVSTENLSHFIATARALHIKGLENVVANDKALPKQNNVPFETSMTGSNIRNVNLTTDQGVEQVGFPVQARKVHIKHGKSGEFTLAPTQEVIKEDNYDYSDAMDDTRNDSDDDMRPLANSTTVKKWPAPLASGESQDKSAVSNLQFTVSNRGSLQIILNRYLYNLHSTSRKAGMRRWRCVDYRGSRCPAFVITKGNIVSNRSNPHNHIFHDKKILSKIERKIVYSALDEVQGVKPAAEQDSFSASDLNDDMNDKV